MAITATWVDLTRMRAIKRGGAGKMAIDASVPGRIFSN